MEVCQRSVNQTLILYLIHERLFMIPSRYLALFVSILIHLVAEIQTLFTAFKVQTL